MSSSSQKFFLILATIAVALFLCFWKLGSVPVAEWDEARYGANAVEMQRTGDFINYHYNGKYDFWNAKPPLQVWGIVLSSKVFGANEFSMRFPSAIGALVAFVFLFLIGRDLGGFRLGLLFVWGAMLTRAIVGYHVSRSGDMDALFVAGLAASDFFLRRALAAKKQTWNWIGLALGLILAFFAKGFAIFLVFPGYAILLLWGAWKQIFTSKKFWAGIGVLVMGIGLWLAVLAKYGAKDPEKQYNGDNAVAVMIVYDVFTRFSTGLDVKDGRNPKLILEFLDTRFGAFYYWTILAGIAVAISRRKKVLAAKTLFFKNISTRDDAWRYSWVMALSLLIILGISQNKLNWYVAPLALWLPCIMIYFADRISDISVKAKKIAIGTLALVFAVNFAHVVRSIIAADQAPSPIRDFVRDHKEDLQKVALLNVGRGLRQDEYLYLLWAVGGKIQSGTDPQSQDPLFPETYALQCAGENCELKPNGVIKPE